MKSKRVFSPRYILTCNESFDILESSAVVYGDKIEEIISRDEALERYGEILEIDDSSILMPGLFNPHVHFEFSKNRAHLHYGSFSLWLKSVLKKREEIIVSQESIEESIQEAISYGSVGFGAISSYGMDLESLSKSRAKVLYLNEAIGSNPAAIDTLYSDFLARFEEGSERESERFKNGIAIHSPYSIHPIYAKKIIELAIKENLKISTHFLESKEEREWLESSSGFFLDFFLEFFGVGTKSHFCVDSFLELFLECKEPIFVHMLEATKSEVDRVLDIGAYIVSTPRSNRLLNNRYLDLDICKAPLFATDGLSSNYSLSLFDELRTTLFAYPSRDIRELAKIAILGVTRESARALGFNSGEIERGRCADMLLLDVPLGLNSKSDLPLQIILHTTKPKRVIIDGEF